MSLSQTCHLIVLSTITFFSMHLQAQDARRDSFVKLFQFAERFDLAAEVLDRFITAQAGGQSVSHRDTETQPL